MKRCPFCGGHGALKSTPKSLLFVECETEICGAASKPAATEEGALANWTNHVRAREAIPSDWRLYAVPLSEAA